MINKTVQFRYFDTLGEDEVREKVAAAQWGSDQIHLALEWLRQKDQACVDEQARRLEAAREEELSIARSATDAARAATQFAKAARRRATIALMIALISTLAAIAAVVISIMGNGAFHL